MKLLVASEGKRDVGRVEPFQDPEPGPLPVIVRRLLREPSALVIETRRLARVHGRGETRAPPLKGMAFKAYRVIRDAQRDGFDGVGVVVDCDTKKPRQQHDELAKARSKATAEREIPAAIGVAVPMLDAWLLGDGPAFKRAFGCRVEVPDRPEDQTRAGSSARHAKKVLERCLQHAHATGTWSEQYAHLAEHLDLDEVARRCPKGFAPFAEEVRENLLPLAER